jgi:DNA-binding NtrC family response regulator
MTAETLQDTATSYRPRAEQAGIVVVFSGDRPSCEPFPLDGSALVLGRECPEGASIDDARMSRRHAEVAAGPAGWVVRDLGSRNGTHVNGRPVSGTIVCQSPPVVRMGRTIALAVPDIFPFRDARPMREGDRVLGPTSRATLAEIAAVAVSGNNLLLTGESGCGKERAASDFHVAGPHANGPLVAVNCAAIPQGIAERLLFGAIKGAYSGASTDAQGYIRAAEGGVLFLDEFGELELQVQAKLLRVIEDKEVLPVGASRGYRAETRFCFSSNRDLKAAVNRGEFRSDLYYRVAQSVVAIAPLRERREEIPWLAQLAVDGATPGLTLDAKLVEACMLRSWTGNVRELLGEVRGMARAAQRQSCRTVGLEPLAPSATDSVEALKASRPKVTAEQIVRALRETPNVSAAARQLGIHRTHLHRLIRQFGIDRRPG